MSQGVIYILTSKSFPDLVKIGYASNLERRVRELNRSEVLPYPFHPYAYYKVDEKLTDRALHKLLDKLNPRLRAEEMVNGKTRRREFFALQPEEAYEILEVIAQLSGTLHRLHRLVEAPKEMPTVVAEDLSSQKSSRKKSKRGEKKKTPRRKAFRFSMIGVEPGEEVQFLYDSTISAMVLDDRHVLFQNEKTSLSKLAEKLMGSRHPLQGTIYFTYRGKILDDLRKEKESQ